MTISAHDESVIAGVLETTLTLLMSVGPLGKIIREHPDLRSNAEPRVRAALAAKQRSSEVALKAATWIVTGKA